jgi:very-short-patch-repair endonuclease
LGGCGFRDDHEVTFDEWLAAQRGAVKRSAAAALGYDASFRSAVRRGILVKVADDLYLPAYAVHGAVDLGTRAGALAAAFGPDALVSCATAAELHGVATLRCCPRIHLTREPGRDAMAYRTPYVDLRLAGLPNSHRTLIDGVPAVTVARAVIDVARTRPFVDGVVAADSALHAGLDPELLNEALADCAGWPGIRKARAVVAFADSRSESALESGGRWAMHLGGLPKPDLQVGIGPYRVDFFFPEHGTVGEADGLAKYRDESRDVAQAQHDRDAEIVDRGLEVVHFNWADAFVRPPARLAARFRRAFGRAAQRRPAS